MSILTNLHKKILFQALCLVLKRSFWLFFSYLLNVWFLVNNNMKTLSLPGETLQSNCKLHEKRHSFESCTTHSKVHTNFVLWIRKTSKWGQKYEQFDCSEEKKCVPDNNLPNPFNWSWNMTNESYSTSFWHCGDQWSTC